MRTLGSPTGPGDRLDLAPGLVRATTLGTGSPGVVARSEVDVVPGDPARAAARLWAMAAATAAGIRRG
jgi:hypothetical protein